MDTKPNTFGHPGKKSSLKDWIKYSTEFLKYNYIYDTILIDGRFRVACCLNCFKVMNYNSIILFDDFKNRDYYHIVLDYYNIIDNGTRMVVLQKKKNILPPNKDIINKYIKDQR